MHTLRGYHNRPELSSIRLPGSRATSLKIITRTSIMHRVSLKKSTQLKKSIQFSGGGAPQPSVAFSVAFTDDPSMVLQ